MGNSTFEKFLDALGLKESSDDYTKENVFGFIGRYQMGEAALVDTGYLKSA